jgi:hypothetical protein
MCRDFQQIEFSIENKVSEKVYWSINTLKTKDEQNLLKLGI